MWERPKTSAAAAFLPPRPEGYPEAVVDFVRRAVELPKATPVRVGGRTAVRSGRVVHSSTLDGLGLLSQTRVHSRRLSSRRGRRAGLLAGNRIAINGVGGDEPLIAINGVGGG